MTSPQDRPIAGVHDDPESHPFRGRRALVVGGSGGIGRSVAIELARAGASLVVHGGSSGDRLESIRDEVAALRAPDSTVETFLLRLDRPADLIRMLPELGDFDILACCFGPFLRKSLFRTTPEDWERSTLLNLALPGALASALLPAMGARGWGRMLFFGGTRTDGIRGYSSNAAYAAAKTGVAVLVKSLAIEGAAMGVASVAVCPGLVDTEYLDESSRKDLSVRAPGGRLASTMDVARGAVALIAADPCLASGAIVSFDGGLAF